LSETLKITSEKSLKIAYRRAVTFHPGKAEYEGEVLPA
jgi:hypothetical protein